MSVTTKAKQRRGRFITLEGIDGAGKSTHLGWVRRRLEAAGLTVTMTREPGGTPLGESIRDLVIGQDMDPETETLLVFGSRREHLVRVILPALARGEWVVSDRFTDATFAYQGGGRGVPASKIAALERWVQGSFQPDLTLLFDLPEAVAQLRMDGSRPLDRFEREQVQFHAAVRSAYLARAAADPRRVRIVDASRAPGDVEKSLEEILSIFCDI
jgi:dTMP kinase